MISADRTVLTALDQSSVTHDSLTGKDFVIYGSYSETGKRAEPELTVNLTITNKSSGDIFSKSYKTSTDIDLFDSIDRISEDIGSFLLKEKTRIAHLSFGNFKTGPYEYELRLNGRRLAQVTNDSFSMKLNIISGKDYHVEMTRVFDGHKVLGSDVNLLPGDNTNISYIEDVKYTINFDGDLFDNGAASTVEGNNIVRHHRYFLDSCSKGYDANLTITADTENYGLEVSEGKPGSGDPKDLHFTAVRLNIVIWMFRVLRLNSIPTTIFP